MFDKVPFGGLRFEFYGGWVITGKWLASSDATLGGMFSRSYDSGFHIFTHRWEADHWRDSDKQEVVKVMYRNGHTAGTNGGHDVIVAKEMYVPND